MNGNMIHLKMLNRVRFQNINKDMKVRETKMEILYVIIFGIREYMFLRIGKINNIKILKKDII